MSEMPKFSQENTHTLSFEERNVPNCNESNKSDNST